MDTLTGFVAPAVVFLLTLASGLRLSRAGKPLNSAIFNVHKLIALAAMIREEFGRPVGVIGISTGGSIVQEFAADHPDLVRRLVIHSSAHMLSAPARAAQMEVGRLAGQRRWREAWTTLLRFMLPPGPLAGPQLRLASLLLSLNTPKDPSDLVITVEAEGRFYFKERLGQITAPTLVVAGDRDPFYTPALFRETAEGIPNARLIRYPGVGHPAGGKQFRRDVLAFLKEENYIFP